MLLLFMRITPMKNFIFCLILFSFGYGQSIRNPKIKRQLPSDKNAEFFCMGCINMVGQFLLAVNRSENANSRVNLVQLNKAKTDFIQICKSFDFVPDIVCDKLVEQYQKPIIYLMERIQASPDEICGAIIDKCGDPRFLLEYQPLALPEMPKNRSIAKLRHAESTVKPMRILQLSDIHVDFEYSIGSEAHCFEKSPQKFCCRHFQEQNSTIIQPAGFWGTLAFCDIPYRTLISALNHIRDNEANIDLVLVSGDFIAHDIWEYSVDRTIGEIKNISDTIREILQVPVYLVVGNHEGNPMDSFMTHDMENFDKFGPFWSYKAFADSMLKELGAVGPIRQEMIYRGSYAARIRPGLKLISLNNNYCSKLNTFGYLNRNDPDQTLSWLIQELSQSELINERVWITSHIPPNDDYCVKSWTWNYYNIVKRFQNTIAQQFFAHTHYDEFFVFLNEENGSPEPFSYGWIGPSLTTHGNVAPAYKVYEIDGDLNSDTRFTAIDAYTVSADLSNPNSEPTWKVEYDFKQAYNMKSLSPESLFELALKFEKDDQLFSDYLVRYFRNPNHSDISNDGKRAKIMCDMKKSKSYDGSICL